MDYKIRMSQVQHNKPRIIISEIKDQLKKQILTPDSYDIHVRKRKLKWKSPGMIFSESQSSTSFALFCPYLLKG